MKKGYRYGLYVLAGIWVVAMAALSPQFVAAHRETRDVLQAFDQYSSELVNQQFAEAYQHCGADFRTAMPFDQFVTLQKSLETQLGHLRSTKRTAYEVHGKGTPMSWRAVIDADMLYENKSLRFEFVFHKEGGRWIIYGYEQL